MHARRSDVLSRERYGISAMTHRDDVERKMRLQLASVGEKSLSSSVFQSLDSSFSQISVRNTTNADSAGYERTFSIRTPTGTTYNVVRMTMVGNQSRIVSASAPTLAKARKYIAIGLAELH